jgi:hypothetical protein
VKEDGAPAVRDAEFKHWHRREVAERVAALAALAANDITEHDTHFMLAERFAACARSLADESPESSGDG